ncbi:hypothetical protein [Burkholderia savannae]|uniref:hypothetical protein n=1 Tax=Burkholderia savannae TaxID=1637837 RepID=UPI0012E38DDB|nr:hypothetical protein [Burkholderia savannae]
MIIRNMKAYRNYWNLFVKIVVSVDPTGTNAGGCGAPIRRFADSPIRRFADSLIR